MKFKVIFISILMASFVFAKEAERKETERKDAVPRKVAQSAPACIPLGQSWEAPLDAGYSPEEINLMKNSIYAQYGFKFKDKKIADEMVRRGCQKDNVTFDAKKIDPIDKKNADYLNEMEENAKFQDPGGVFKKDWANAEGNPKKRKELISNSYCYLSDSSNKYFGIVLFTSKKSKNGLYLSGMMDVTKPTWKEPYKPSKNEDAESAAESREWEASEGKRIADKVSDTTSMQSLAFKSSGSWTINSSKTDKAGKVQITMNTKHKDMKNAFVEVDTDGYNQSNILNCKLVD